MMPTEALATLRKVNRNIRFALARLRPEQRKCSTITPRDFSDLLGELLQAGECLRQAHFPARPAAEGEEAAALARESLEYRNNLEKLKRFLPSLHGHLLAEKARLENAQTHVAAAAAWARVSKKTL